MTDEERLKRYEAIVKWGKEYVEYMKSIDGFKYDEQLLQEYMKAMEQLKEQKNS